MPEKNLDVYKSNLFKEVELWFNSRQDDSSTEIKTTLQSICPWVA